MDQCEYCMVKGKLKECLKIPCGQHNSWRVKELRKILQEAIGHNIFCELYNCSTCK